MPGVLLGAVRGVYIRASLSGAPSCSRTFWRLLYYGEALSMASMAVAGGYADPSVCCFQPFRGGRERVPLSPITGTSAPSSVSWTVTGSGACVVTGKKGKVRITGLTTKICGFRSERFPEDPRGMHGSGSLRYHKPDLGRSDSSRRITTGL